MSELQSHHCMFEQINRIRTAVHGHPQLSLKCRLSNRVSFDVFDQCFCKVETRVRETLRSCAKRLRGLAVTTLPGASPSLNPVLDTSCSGVQKGGRAARPKSWSTRTFFHLLYFMHMNVITFYTSCI